MKHYKIIFGLVCLLLYSLISIAQIKSFHQKEATLKPKFRSTSISEFKLSANEIKKNLIQDSIEMLQGLPFRFGKDIAVDIDFFNRASSYNKGTLLIIYMK